MGMDRNNTLTQIGVAADHAEEMDSPLAAVYRAIFNQQGKEPPELGGRLRYDSGDPHAQNGHHATWTPDRQDIIYHTFYPLPGGRTAISVGGTHFHRDEEREASLRAGRESWSSIPSQYGVVPQEVAEAALAQLHEADPSGSYWTTNWDAPSGPGDEDRYAPRVHVDDPVAALRVSQGRVTPRPGDTSVPHPERLSRREVALRYAKKSQDDQDLEDSIPWDKAEKKPKPEKPFSTPASSVTAVQSPTWMRPAKDSGGMTSWKGVPGSPQIHPVIRGTRLAVVLREIGNRFGKKNAAFKRLADEALTGKGNIGHEKDVYNRIRNLLLHHAANASPVLGRKQYTVEESRRMEQLARQYNWHRVGKGVQLDEAVSDYVNKIASDKLKSQNSQMRAAHNLFGYGWETRQKPASAEARAAFLKGLSDHVRKVGVGADSVYGMTGRDVDEKALLRSLRRLGQAEEQNEHLARATPTSKVSPIDPENPAWVGKPQKPRVSPKARAGQYSRREVARKYAFGLWGRRKAEADPAGGEIVKNAVARVLQNLGVGTEHVDRYIQAIRRHLTHPNTKDDPLSQTFREGVARANAPTGVFDVANRVRGMVGYYASQFGHHTPEFSLYEPKDLLAPTDPVAEEGPFDLADDFVHDHDLSQHFQIAPPVKPIRPRNPGLPRDKRAAIYKDIADFRKRAAGGKPVTRSDTVQMIAEKHGIDPSEADKHLENYNKLKSRPESGEVPASSPGKAGAKGKVKARKFGRAPIEAAVVDEFGIDTTTPEKPQQYRRRVRPKRYSGQATINALMSQLMELSPEANAHRRGWDENPVNGLRGILADALQDEGREDEANLAREKGRHVIAKGGRLIPGELIFRTDDGYTFVHMFASEHGDHAGQHVWTNGDMEFPGDANGPENVNNDEDVNSLHGQVMEVPDPDHPMNKGEENYREGSRWWMNNQGQDDPPQQYAAYRAPQGGMVARGTYYKGGEMVPDMEGEFMNPPKAPKPKAETRRGFDPKKLAAARSKWRVKKMPPAVANADGTSAPASTLKKFKFPT